MTSIQLTQQSHLLKEKRDLGLHTDAKKSLQAYRKNMSYLTSAICGLKSLSYGSCQLILKAPTLDLHTEHKFGEAEMLFHMFT